MTRHLTYSQAMPNIEVSIEIFCSCGAGICGNASVTSRNSSRPAFTVEPCEKCIERADSEGYERGEKDGYEKGKADAE